MPVCTPRAVSPVARDSRDTNLLPPTQYLVLEVLAARMRTGERMWTFPASVKQALDALRSTGLIGYRSGPAPRAYQAWLTEAGKAIALSLRYQLPVPTLADALDTLPREDEQYLSWMRRHGLGHGAGVATVVSAVRADLRNLTTETKVSGDLNG